MQFVTIDDPHDGRRRWRVDAEFLTSNWTCIWGRGCQGILPEPAEHLGHGCCSVGAGMLDEDEARLTSALAAMLDPEHFQYHAVAAADGVFADASNRQTRVVDDACIFLNRPGFEGGAGCALHLAALQADDSPTEWKPSVCWQLPVKVDRADASGEVVTLRPWTRADWGSDATELAWMCTERSAEPSAFVGDERVIDSLRDELTELLSPELYEKVRAALDVIDIGGGADDELD